MAGFVLRSREPLVIEDVERDPRFARDVAEQTGYVPKALMVAPLLRGDEALGVLSVLDRSTERALALAEIDLLVLFSRQAALALQVIEKARGAGSALEGEGETAVVGRLAEAIEGLEGPRREAGLRMLAALEELLGGLAPNTAMMPSPMKATSAPRSRNADSWSSGVPSHQGQEGSAAAGLTR